MKKLIVFLLVFLPVFCFAESRDHMSEVTVYAGGFFGDKFVSPPASLFGEVETVFDDDATFGFRYGYNITPTFEVEGGLGFTPASVLVASSTDGGTNAGAAVDVDTYVMHGNLVAHLFQGPVLPYVTGGIGAVHFGFQQNNFGNNPSETDFAFNAGGGLKIPVKEDIAIRMDSRVYWMNPEFADGTTTFVEVSGGISILWNF